MSNQSITAHEIEAFRRFVLLLPRERDPTLLILKGHLLIEEQIRKIIDERVEKPEVVAEAQLDCFQAICLAEALCANSSNLSLWKSLRRLNNLRNDIAHKIDDKGLEDKMTHLVSMVKAHSMIGEAGTTGESTLDAFGFALWFVFCQVAALVKRPAAPVLELLPSSTNAA